jgi:hypothetical protein
MAPIPKPPFPNVPNLPGVPQLRRSPLFPANPGPVLGTAIALGSLWRSLFATPRWGVFKQVPEPGPDEGGIQTVVVRGRLQPAVDCDSVLDFGYRNEYDISDYPVQDGDFATYNKVANPYETYVRMSKGGSVEDRDRFLSQINDILKTTDLYYILTPEKQYVNVNPYRHEVTRKEASGAYFLTEVDLYFREIRSVTAQYTQTAVSTQNAKNPDAAPVDNGGTKQGLPVDPEPVIDGVVNK